MREGPLLVQTKNSKYFWVHRTWGKENTANYKPLGQTDLKLAASTQRASLQARWTTNGKQLSHEAGDLEGVTVVPGHQWGIWLHAEEELSKNTSSIY